MRKKVSKLKTDFKSLGDDCLLLSRKKKKAAHRKEKISRPKSCSPFSFSFPKRSTYALLTHEKEGGNDLFWRPLGVPRRQFWPVQRRRGGGEGSFSLSSFRSNFQDKEEEGRHKSGGSGGRGRKAFYAKTESRVERGGLAFLLTAKQFGVSSLDGRAKASFVFLCSGELPWGAGVYCSTVKWLLG